MMSIDCTTLCLPLLCKKLDYMPTAAAQCIVALHDGIPTAGVIYDGYNEKSISAHIWVQKGAMINKEWCVAIFDYPFNRLQVGKIIGQVASGNVAARRLDEHFGFVVEAVIKDYSNDGDLMLYSMTKEQCHVLNSPLWQRPVKHIMEVANGR